MYTIPKIKTLAQLRSYLHSGPGYDGYEVLMNSVELPASEYQDLCRWDSNDYQKVVLEMEEECYELVLICWEKGQQSPIHDHSSSESWIKVLQGELTERVFYSDNSDGGALNPKESSSYSEGELIYVQDNYGFHQIANSNDGRTISLHLYSPPVDSYKSYDEETGEIIE